MKECDITKVQVLFDLFAISPEKRDDEWKDKFYANVVDASFRCEMPQICRGPDGFPYFSLLTPEPLKRFDSYCICNLVEPATRDGFGITINRRADGADWVFSCGDLLTLRFTGSLKTPPVPDIQKTEITQQEEKVLVAAPSESLLPSYTRANIRRFMQQSLGVQNPGVFLVFRPSAVPPQQLVFSFFFEKTMPRSQSFSAYSNGFRGFCLEIIQSPAFRRYRKCVGILSRYKGSTAMADRRKQIVRHPATKFANLRKKMDQKRLRAKVARNK